MDVIFGIIGWVILNDPVNLWEVQTSLGDICTKEDASLSLTEFKVGRGSLLLFLFPMDVLNWDVNVVKKIRVELDCITTAHENHHLLLKVFL